MALSVVDSVDGETEAQASAAAVPEGATVAARFDRLGWLAVLTTMLWPLVETIRILAQPVHEVVFGDYALFELSARRAWHLDQLLGPNAAAGFNHPGPAMFYLLAPAVRLLEPGPGLYFGALLINAAALLAVVVVMWRLAGSRVALWTACALNLFCLAVGLDVLRQPSNPMLLVIPMALFVVLWAGSVTRVPGAWLWAAVVGSYEIQTHITAGLFVTIMVLAGGAAGLVAFLRRPSPRLPNRWWLRPARVTGVVALALIWLPSTVELFVDHPNNWNATWHWLHHGHNPGIAVGTSLGVVVRAIAIFPFQHHVWTAALPYNRAEQIAGWLIIAAGLLLIGWLVARRLWFAFALAIAAILAVPVATITVSHAGGDNFAFLTGWVSFVPYLLLLALGVGLLTPATVSPPRPQVRGLVAVQVGVAWLAIAAVTCASVAAVADLSSTSLASINRAYARDSTFVAAARAQLRPGDHWVGVLIVSGADWEFAAGVVLELERLGYHTFVDPRDAFLFGKQMTTWNHSVQEVFTFYSAYNIQAARNDIGTLVSASSGTAMTAVRLNP